MANGNKKLVRIGVFYDGAFFSSVSRYYRYTHARKRHINIPGLHEFIRHKTAQLEGIDVVHCRIVDAHLFQGRHLADKATPEQLYNDRVFDGILMSAGIAMHHLPVLYGKEKGVDVWLALEAFELTIYKHFDLLVIIAGDADFIQLVRKVNSLGTQVMVLGWDFTFQGMTGEQQTTKTSTRLLESVTYPLKMEQIIDTAGDETMVGNLFSPQ